MSEAIEQEIRTLRAQFWSHRDPEGRAFVPLADAYRRKGDLDEAVSLVQDGLARLPDFTPGHLVAARIHRAKGDLEGARVSLDHVLELDSANVLALLERAEVARDTGDHESAVSDLRRLLELDPGHMGARAALDRLEAAPPEPAVADPDPVEAAASPQDELEVDELEIDGPEADELEIDDLEIDELEIGSPQDELEVDELEIDELELEPTGPQTVAVDDEDFDFDLGGFDDEGARATTDEAAMEAEPEPVEASSADEPALEAEPDLAEFSDLVEAEATTAPSGGDESDASLMTRTMADIFARQGLTDRAVEVYERLLERSPDDDELRSRLDELKALSGGAVADEEAEEPELSQVAPQWADDGQAEAEAPSPFAWDATEEEPEEEIGAEAPPDASRAGPARTIRDHFEDILAWEPGAVPVETLSPEADEAHAPEGSLLDLRRKRVTEPPPAPEAPAQGTEEDDDLDDFRSWLKSLES